MPGPVVPANQSDPVADYLAKYGPKPQGTVPSAAPATDPVAHYLATYATPAPVAKPGVLSRAGSMIAAAVPHSFSQLGHEVSSLVTAPIKSFVTANRAAAEQDAENAVASSGGPIGAVPRTVSPKDAAIASVQAASVLALPELTSGIANRLGGSFAARLAGRAAGGATAGAAFTPDDPFAGAIAGAAVGEAAHEVGAGAGKVGGTVIDMSGKRPMVTRPLVKIGPLSLGTVEGVTDRATRLNQRILTANPTPDGMAATSTKPVAPLDVAGSAGVRAARGLKTASPGAEAVLRPALQDRASGAVDRVIQHGLEATGLASRENGLQVVDDMIAQRTQHGNENDQPVFEKYTAPLTDTRFDEVANTPAGKQVLKRAGILAANRGESIGMADAAFDPSTLPADKQAMYAKLLELNGGQTEPAAAAMRALGESTAPAGPPGIAPTLKQAHYVKLAFDDMLNSAPEPGSGGMGPNNAGAIRALKAKWVGAMDDAAPEYATARKTFADESDLVRGAELGRQLWKLHPDEAAKAFNDLPEAARDVARRTGFDALAERIENGPADVERGVSKPRDQRRMKLLFPDENSFNQFKQGLGEEAQLHANEQGVLGGSNTADKLADVANMAGVTLPDVVRAAATGRWHRLLGQAAAGATRKLMGAGGEAVSAERARQLVAGSNGDLGARTAALNRLGLSRPTLPPVTVATQAQQPTQPAPVPIRALLPAGRFDSGDLQGQAMPIPQPLPKNRRLAPGQTFPAVAGDVQQGAALPIRQPLPMNHRLLSGGQAGVPTAGDVQVGPGIPTPGQALEDAVREELMRLYRKRPELAVSMSPDDQARLAAQVRARIAGGAP